MLDANSQYRARRAKEEKEDTSLRLRVSAVNLFSRYLSRPFRERRKGRMLKVVHSDINLRGKGSLRDEFRARGSKKKKESSNSQ